MPFDELSPFGRGPDLNDPNQFAAELEVQAGGLEQQSQSARSNSALGGHPAPSQLYERCAMLMRYAAERIRKLEGKVAAVPATDPVSVPAGTLAAAGDNGGKRGR